MTATFDHDYEFDDDNAASEKYYQHLFYQAPVASLLLSRDGHIREINRRAAEMLAIHSGEYVGQALLVFVRPKDQLALTDHIAAVFSQGRQQSLDIELQTTDGRLVYTRMISLPVEGKLDLCQTTLLDLNEQTRDENLLNQLAYYDQLTGLPNRILFSDRLHWAIRDARRQNERLAVMVIDLDHFKQVNDTLGHEAGDQLLQAVAARMLACLREADTLSRMGGDEFTALMLHIGDNQDAIAAAGRLLEAITQPVEIKGKPQTVSASIGICLYPDDGEEADQLIHNADIAMYRAKTSGRSRISFFSKSLKAAVSRQNEMEHRLRLALPEQQLEVYYQPFIDAITCRIIGLEALLRWRSDHNGVMTAGQFLPIADQLGLADSFEDWALQSACLQMKDWINRGVIRDLGQCRMAVNLSVNQLEKPDLCSRITSILQSIGLPGSALALEASETTLRQGSKIVLENLKNIHQQGIALHLDDFSQGFSSLQTINKIPFDCLKIDQIYTSVFLENKQGEALLDALLNLSHILGLRVIAEGVESPQAYAWLKEHACDGMQGFYFCRPLPALKMEMLLGLPQSS